MNFAEFDTFWFKRLREIKKLEETKRGEYNDGRHRFDQFQKEAEEAGIDPKVVWKIYFSKHYRSLMMYIRDCQQSTIRPLSEPIDGRINDMIVYLMIVAGMLQEEKEKIRAQLDQFDPVVIPVPSPVESFRKLDPKEDIFTKKLVDLDERFLAQQLNAIRTKPDELFGSQDGAPTNLTFNGGYVDVKIENPNQQSPQQPIKS